jgi:hypothetical protein
LIPPWHALVVRRADKLEDDLCLVYVALACKNGLALEHLAKDAAGTPHVDGRRVLSQLQKQLWRPVPSSHNQSCVLALGFAVAPASLWYSFVVVSRETEIGYLKSPAVVDEKVGSLHVSM